jgi:hypothetical protein
LRELGAPAEPGAWPYDDLVLTWSITRDCRAVTLYLVETTTGIERAIARVTDDHYLVFPSRVMLSPDSRSLAFVCMKIGGPPYFWVPVLVDVHRAAAALYAKAAQNESRRGQALNEKARQACRRAQ